MSKIGIVLLVLSLLARAEEEKLSFTTTDRFQPRKFENVTLSTVEPDGITVTTDSGIEKVSFAELPANIRAKFGYKPEAAAAYSATLSRAQHETFQRGQAETIAEEQRKRAILTPTSSPPAVAMKTSQGSPQKTVRIQGKIVDRVSEGVFVVIEHPPSRESMEAGLQKQDEYALRNYLKGGRYMAGNNVGQGGRAPLPGKTEETVFVSGARDAFASTIDIQAVPTGIQSLRGHKNVKTYVAH